MNKLAKYKMSKSEYKYNLISEICQKTGQTGKTVSFETSCGKGGRRRTK